MVTEEQVTEGANSPAADESAQATAENTGTQNIPPLSEDQADRLKAASELVESVENPPTEKGLPNEKKQSEQASESEQKKTSGEEDDWAAKGAKVGMTGEEYKAAKLKNVDH